MLFFHNKDQQPGLPGKRNIIFFLIPVVLFLGYLFFRTPQPDPWLLVVRAVTLKQNIYSITVKPNDQFTLSYTHSVSGRPVSGTFIITSRGDIKPFSTEFDSYGPGLPVPDDSTEYEIKDGLIIVYHDEEPRDRIRLFVSPLTGEKLIINGIEYDLTFHQEKPLLMEIYVTMP
jgi:hypothetical protein